MTEFISALLNKISSKVLHLKNRWLLARINKVYADEIDPDEKKLLKAHGKSFRKLIEDEW